VQPRNQDHFVAGPPIGTDTSANSGRNFHRASRRPKYPCLGAFSVSSTPTAQTHGLQQNISRYLSCFLCPLRVLRRSSAPSVLNLFLPPSNSGTCSSSVTNYSKRPARRGIIGIVKITQPNANQAKPAVVSQARTRSRSDSCIVSSLARRRRRTWRWLRVRILKSLVFNFSTTVRAIVVTPARCRSMCARQVFESLAPFPASKYNPVKRVLGRYGSRGLSERTSLLSISRASRRAARQYRPIGLRVPPNPFAAGRGPFALQLLQLFFCAFSNSWYSPTGSGSKMNLLLPVVMTNNHPVFSSPEAIFARNLFGATPADAVKLSCQADLLANRPCHCVAAGNHCLVSRNIGDRLRQATTLNQWYGVLKNFAAPRWETAR